MTFRIGIELGLTGASQVKDGLKDIGGAAKGLADEFSKGLKTGMDQAVREMNRPMEELKAMANQAAMALDIRPDWKIQEEIDKTRKAYDDLKASGLATSGELTRAKQAMKDKVGELRQEMGKWSGDWDEIAGKLDRFGSKLQALGAKSMIAGAPAILAGRASIEAEHSLAGIANTSGIDPARVEQTVAAWKAKIAELSVFTNQKQSELVEAMGVMVSRGLDPEKALAMLGPIGNAATATGGKISDIARTLYATYDNLKVPIDESAKTLDVLATAGNRGAFELKDMAQHLPSLTAIAGSLKMVGIESTAQIAAAAQIAMKGAGDASQAANNLQNFLLKLSAPDTMKAFKDAGINLSAEIRKGLDSGDLIGHIAGVVQQATNGDAEKISTLFRDAQVKQFVTPMLANIDEYKAIRDQALAAIGTIDKQKAVMEQTTAEKFKGIGNSFDAAIEKSSLFQGVLDKIKGTADWFAANPGVFEPIATVVTALAVGGAGLAAAGVALPAIATGISAITTAANAIMPVLSTVATFAAANPIVLALLGVAVAGGMVWANWDEIVAGARTAWNDLTGLVTDAFDAIAKKYTEWKAAGSALIDNLKAGIQAKAGELLNGLGIVAQLDKGIKIVSGTVASWTKVGADLIDGLWEGIKATMRKPLEAIGDLSKKLPQWAKDLLGIKSPSTVFMGIGSDIGAGLAQGISGSVSVVKASAEKMGRDAVSAAKDVIGKAGTQLGAELATGFAGGIKATQPVVNKAAQAYVAEATQAASKASFNIADSFKGLITDLGASLKAFGKRSYGWLTESLTAAFKSGIEVLSPWLKESVKLFNEASRDIEKTLNDALMRGMEGGRGAMRGLAETMRNAFSTLVLRPIIQPVLSSASGLVGGALGLYASTPATAATGVANSAGIFGGLLGQSSLFSGATTGFSLALQNFATGGLSGLGSTATLIGESFSSGAFGTALGAAMPIIGAIGLLTSLFGRKAPNRSAWGSLNLDTGAQFGLGAQTDDKAPTQETLQARSALLSAIGGFTSMLEGLGGSVSGHLFAGIGERTGITVKSGGSDGTLLAQGTDVQEVLRATFRALTNEAEDLDGNMRSLLLRFDGTAEEMTSFAEAMGGIRDYLNSELAVTVADEIRRAGRSAWQAWSDAGAATRTAMAGFDGSLAKAQALGSATAAMYQSELALVGQIQGLLKSTSAAFGDSIRSIEMSVLDSAGRYDYLRAEIDAAYASLGAAADPQVIGDLASQINRLSMEAYGLLDEGQKRGAADEYTAYLREVNTLTADRLNAAQDRVEGQHAEMVAAIEDAMSRVAARMEAAAAAQQAAAATPVQVASTIRVDFNADIPGTAEVGYGQG